MSRRFETTVILQASKQASKHTMRRRINLSIGRTKESQPSLTAIADNSQTIHSASSDRTTDVTRYSLSILQQAACATALLACLRSKEVKKQLLLDITRSPRRQPTKKMETKSLDCFLLIVPHQHSPASKQASREQRRNALLAAVPAVAAIASDVL